jgi:hypothetical protein
MLSLCGFSPVCTLLPLSALLWPAIEMLALV